MLVVHVDVEVRISKPFAVHKFAIGTSLFLVVLLLKVFEVVRTPHCLLAAAPDSRLRLNQKLATTIYLVMSCCHTACELNPA